jgi:hypothetical protein
MLEDFGEYLKRLGKVADAVSWLLFCACVSKEVGQTRIEKG